MPIVLRKDHRIDKGYHGFELLNSGMMANSYSAIDPSGTKVFFKQFGSPSVRVKWYPGFKKYQQKIKGKIENSDAAGFCYKWLDQFEASVLKEDGTPRKGRAFNQTYEFLDAGSDMEKELEKARGGLEAMSFEDRVMNSKIMMNAIDAIHEAGVVHTDLKPDNLMLMENNDEFVDAKYELKLIDMDFALLVDEQAPWHGVAGYTGTPGWFSPEHLQAGAIPVPASDVFTCGLILYELLAGVQPLEDLDQDQYLPTIVSGKIPPPKLLGKMEDFDPPASTAAVEQIIHRCLNIEPVKRPSAAEVNKALNEEVEIGEISDPPEPIIDPPEPIIDIDPAEPGLGGIQGKLILTNDLGGKLSMGVETKMGKTLVQQFGEDHKFWHSEQFTLNKDSEGFWQVIPNNDAPNETMVNSRKITETSRLQEGDVLAVGREEKGIIKLPLRVGPE